MRKILILMLLALGSCASISQLNRNMETTNELMVENIEMVKESIVSVDHNTKEIERSTRTMYVLPFLGLVFLVILFTPIFILFKMYRKLLREVSRKDR